MLEIIFKLGLFFSVIYVIWYGSGGVERGEERARNHTNDLFTEVGGVPDSYKNGEFFGSFTNDEVQGTSNDEE